MKFKELFEKLQHSNLTDYPLVTLKDIGNYKVSTDKIKYCDLVKLSNVEVLWITTYLPMTINLNCKFSELNIVEEVE